MDLGTSGGRHAALRERRDDGPTGIRRDLQGLRGVGVMLVLIGHLFQWPPGAFAALDMFFLLSGFLITGLLIDAFVRYGRLPFGLFYLSRFRRLVPTAALTIVVTVWLHYVLFSQARGEQVREDGLWALGFGANWHFAQSEGDYFQAQTQSPLLHYWSLSVEEQFYVAWPVLLLGVLLLSRLSKRPTAVLLTGIGLMTAACFGYSLWHSVADPAVAYYSTLDRAWEFGAGGLLAAARKPLARIPGKLGRPMMAVGFVGVLVTALLLDRTVAFPAPWGLASVIVCGLVIAGGVNRQTLCLRALDNPVMVYLGDISYSLYLWHLPVIMVLKPFVPAGFAYITTTLVVIAVVSSASYHLLERPMRFAPWLMLPSERDRFWESTYATRMHRKASGLLLMSGVAGALCLAAFLSIEQPLVAPSPASLAEASRASGSSLVAVEQTRLKAALDAEEFPELDPPVESLGIEDWLDDQEDFGCVDVTAEDLERCLFGPTDGKLALVIGDSYAVAWMPGIRGALEPRGWQVQQLTRLQCTPWTLPIYRQEDGTAFPACKDQHRLIEAYVAARQPDLVIVASSQFQMKIADLAGIDGGPVEVVEQGLAKTLEKLSAASHADLVVLSPPATSGNLMECMTRFAGPDECINTPSPAWHDHVAGESAAAAESGAKYVETVNWFCVELRCPAFVGATPITVDGGHLTLQFSEQLAPLLREALLGAVRPAQSGATARGTSATK